MLNRELVLTVKSGNVENKYTVKFPLVGEFIDIETKKVVLSQDKYLGLIKSGTFSSLKALDFIDMVAFFEVLLPKEFFKDLKVDSILELGALDANELLKVYKEQFLTWITEWQKLMKIIPETKEENGEGSSDGSEKQ
jgi:hypothetical protein